MHPEAQNGTAENTECRALVPLTVAAESGPHIRARTNAAFLTQLSANAKGYSPYRAKRRLNPEDGAMRYRTTVANALAYRPNGQKLNYVA